MKRNQGRSSRQQPGAENTEEDCLKVIAQIFLIQARNSSPGMVLPTVGWALPH